VFAPPLPHRVRYNPYKPLDASSADIFGCELPKQRSNDEDSNRSLSPRAYDRQSSHKRSRTVSARDSQISEARSHEDDDPHSVESCVTPEACDVSCAELTPLSSTQDKARSTYQEEVEAKKTWLSQRRLQLNLLAAAEVDATPKKSQKIYGVNAAEMHRFMNHSLDIPRLPEPSTVEVSVSGLNATEDEFSMRKACSGFHVVSLTTDHDNILGTCKGTAKLRVRAHKPEDTLDRLSLNFAVKGWRVDRSPRQFGKKLNSFAEATNRSFLDNRLQFAERRFRENDYNHRALMLKNLQTSADLFGSSKGTGRWPKSWQEVKVRENRRKQVN
jgi:hypothetical protein